MFRFLLRSFLLLLFLFQIVFLEFIMLVVLPGRFVGCLRTPPSYMI